MRIGFLLFILGLSVTASAQMYRVGEPPARVSVPNRRKKLRLLLRARLAVTVPAANARKALILSRLLQRRKRTLLPPGRPPLQQRAIWLHKLLLPVRLVKRTKTQEKIRRPTPKRAKKSG